MGDMLSQAEIDALLGGGGDSSSDGAAEAGGGAPVQASVSSDGTPLTPEQRDILGEIGNISMGTAATTLFTLLNQKVWITTPQVMDISWEDFKNMHDRPCVGIRVGYKEGLVGSNVLILKERDVKIIANLMMGGEGTGSAIDEELNEIDLSAIGEAMNQMVGSSSTSLSSLTKMKIDIDTPYAFRLDLKDDTFFDNLGFDAQQEDIVAISFRMEVGNLIDSAIMQLIPKAFAVSMVEALKHEMQYNASAATPSIAQSVNQVSEPPMTQQPQAQPMQQMDMMQQQGMMPQQQMMQQPGMMPQQQMMQQPGMMPQQQMMQPQMMPQQQMMQQPGMMMQPQMMQQPGMMMQPQMMYPGMYNDPYQNGGYGMPPQMQPQMQPPQQNVNVQPAQFQNFDYSSVMQQKENIGIIMDVPLEVTVELGRTTRTIKDILEFGPGTIVELHKLAGEPIDVYVNSKFIAKGEVVVIDENFGVRITDIINIEHRI